MGTPTASILVVDDDRIILESLSEYLRFEGFEVVSAEHYRDAVEALQERPFTLLLTDINMPDQDGFELLKYARAEHPETTVVMITGYGTIESAVEAIKLGAYDYVTKPIIDDEIKMIIERAVRQHKLVKENTELRKQLDLRYGIENIVGHDYRMLKVFDLVESVADTKTTVLVTGESGTGKTLVARAVHYRSSRRDKPFIEVSCGALPETLLESELFGHVAGSFTGAIGDRIGKFEQAQGGTIFLDEISSASMAFQVKLLRVLQDREFERVGGTETFHSDARVILATNVDLGKEVEKGNFRQDLYYRINVVSIPMAPLRERIGDIPLLAKHFLAKYCEQNNKQLLGFDDESMVIMQRHRWPGNVRQLENVVERAVVLSKSPSISAEDLPPELLSEPQPIGSLDGVVPLKEALEGPERCIIERALKTNGWNRQVTADALGINRTTLYKKMKRYGLEFDYKQLVEV